MGKYYSIRNSGEGGETVEATVDVYVLVQFFHWFKFYFPLFWSMVMYDNEFKTKGNKIQTKEKIERQRIYSPQLNF